MPAAGWVEPVESEIAADCALLETTQMGQTLGSQSASLHKAQNVVYTQEAAKRLRGRRREGRKCRRRRPCSAGTWKCLELLGVSLHPWEIKQVVMLGI